MFFKECTNKQRLERGLMRAEDGGNFLQVTSIYARMHMFVRVRVGADRGRFG